MSLSLWRKQIECRGCRENHRGEKKKEKGRRGGGVLETKIHKQDRERRREGLLVRDNNHGADTTYCVLSS